MKSTRTTVAVALGVGFLGWLAWAIRVLAYPDVDPIAATAATYVLASTGGDRAIIEGLVAPNRNGALVVSRAVPGVHSDLCDRTDVTCLVPDPSTTQGEASAFAKEAADHGWESVTVFTHTSHVSRSRMLMKRCFGGEVRMVAVGGPANEKYGALDWPMQFIYETGAWLKALVMQGC